MALVGGAGGAAVQQHRPAIGESADYALLCGYGAVGGELCDGVRQLLNAALLYIGLALAQQIVSVLATYTGENLGWTTTNALRADLAAHCLHLDMAFHNTHTPGEMIERLDGDVTALANFFSQFVIQVFGNALLLVGVLMMLFREDWRIGAAFSVFAGLNLVILWRFRDIAVPHWEAERQASADLFGFLEERLGGWRTFAPAARRLT